MYEIFLPDICVTELGISSEDVSQWLLRNLNSPNVFSLREIDVLYLQYETSVLDIINEENDSMLSSGEDAIVFEENVKHKILDCLLKLVQHPKSERYLVSRFDVDEERAQLLINKIIYMIKKSIKQKKSIYFMF
jgi:hypothetical protein